MRFVAFGKQACLRGLGNEILAADDVELRPGFLVVEAQQHIAFLDPCSLADQDRIDDAPLRVLHRLAIGIDADDTRSRHPFVERRQAGPEQKATEADDQGDHAEADDRFLVCFNPAVLRPLIFFDQFAFDGFRFFG